MFEEIIEDVENYFENFIIKYHYNKLSDLTIDFDL
jgi:hypothetical protein